MEDEAPPTSVATDLSPAYDVYDHHRPLDEWDPASTHAQLRRSCPVAHTPAHGGYWVITSHDLVRRCGRDPDTFSSEHDLDGSRMGREFGGIAIPPQGRYRGIPSEIDGTVFHEYRRLLLPWFTPAATTRWLAVNSCHRCGEDRAPPGVGPDRSRAGSGEPRARHGHNDAGGIGGRPVGEVRRSFALPCFRPSSLVELARRVGRHRPSPRGIARAGPSASSVARRGPCFGSSGS